MGVLSKWHGIKLRDSSSYLKAHFHTSRITYFVNEPDVSKSNQASILMTLFAKPALFHLFAVQGTLRSQIHCFLDIHTAIQIDAHSQIVFFMTMISSLLHPPWGSREYYPNRLDAGPILSTPIERPPPQNPRSAQCMTNTHPTNQATSHLPLRYASYPIASGGVSCPGIFV